jgi:anti-sigma factor RsiW
MNCSKAEKLISPYLDGEVSVKEQGLFEAHVKECRVCAGKFEETRAVQTAFGQAMRYRAPGGFSARVMDTIQGNAQARPSFVLLFTRLAAAVVILILIGLGVMTGRFLGSDNRTDKAAEAAAFLSLDIFNATPHDSPGGAYLAMTEGKYEK